MPRQDGGRLSFRANAGVYASAAGPCIGAKHDVPENGGHAVITILEAMMREVPHLCAIEPGVWLYRPAMHGIMDNDEGEIACKKSGENRRPVFHPCGANQQKSDRECKERRSEAGSFGVRIVWMVMMK